MAMSFCSKNLGTAAPIFPIFYAVFALIHRLLTYVFATVKNHKLEPRTPSLVIDKTGAEQRINRTAYEVCVLKILRDKLRCREIWVARAGRYKNPEEDLPQDFEERKEAYYKMLGIPTDIKTYVQSVRSEMMNCLDKFNKSLANNSKVKIISKKGEQRFSVSPFKALPEAENIVHMKDNISKNWSGTSLLDVLKEPELRVGYTAQLKSATERTHMTSSDLQRKLLLCLFGLGTNTGLKSMESKSAESYKELMYVRRRFVSISGLRNAISQVINATLQARKPQIWGMTTTACASDSKQFSAWDQNLLTEWHSRYRSPGVMVYWHVDKNSACVYSQLKKVSSSEAGSMINGVLRHCTEMEIDRQYVDTHGQNTVAFAFCRLLGFELMPRLKNINKQKLYRAAQDLA